MVLAGNVGKTWPPQESYKFSLSENALCGSVPVATVPTKASAFRAPVVDIQATFIVAVSISVHMLGAIAARVSDLIWIWMVEPSLAVARTLLYTTDSIGIPRTACVAAQIVRTGKPTTRTHSCSVIAAAFCITKVAAHITVRPIWARLRSTCTVNSCSCSPIATARWPKNVAFACHVFSSVGDKHYVTTSASHLAHSIRIGRAALIPAGVRTTP